MKKFTRFLSAILAVSVLSCSVFATSVSAATYPSGTKIDGYVGNIWLAVAAPSVVQRGDTLQVGIESTEIEDISKLNVSWSVANSSEASIMDEGFNKGNDQFDATVTFLKDGVTVPIYATVNGIKLEADIKVAADTDGIGSYTWVNGHTDYQYSDTVGTFKVGKNRSYVFMITASGAPDIVAGSNSFKYVSMTSSGNKYYFKFTATGKTGNVCGFYLKGNNLPFAIATIS